MNRRQKIIVSITGIFIVLLALVGLTYAYFLTQIKGNENDKSISVTTANLILEYTDGNGELNPAGKIVPGSDIKFLDEDGNTVTSKTFSVENKGNEVVENYAVTVENYSLINSTTGEEVLFKYPETFVVNVTCTSNKGTCNGLENAAFPESNDILLYNDIEVGEVQTYELTMTYVDNGKDQSADMNKTLSAKINIIDANNTIDLVGEVESYSAGDYVQINSEPKTSRIVKDNDGKYTYKIVGVKPDDHELGVYNKNNTETPKGSSELSIVKGTESSVVGNVITISDISREIRIDITSSYKSTISNEIKSGLKESIIANAKNNKNGTTLITDGSVESKVANEISGENEKILATTLDDYGTSYYFRGNVENNYVNFAGMCWKIVRIEGDGSIKLLLEDQYAECDDKETIKTASMYTGSWAISPTADGTTKTGNFGYNDLKVTKKYLMDYLNPSENSVSTSMVTAFKNFQNTKLTDYLGKLKSGRWCFGDEAYYDSNSTVQLTETEKETIYNSGVWLGGYLENSKGFYYDSAIRLSINFSKTPTLKCKGTFLDEFEEGVEMYVGTLTADEIVYAGANFDISSGNYLSNDKNIIWWTLTPYDFSYIIERVFTVWDNGALFLGEVNSNNISFRPSVSLKSGTIILDGEGTLENPYIIG